MSETYKGFKPESGVKESPVDSPITKRERVGSFYAYTEHANGTYTIYVDYAQMDTLQAVVAAGVRIRSIVEGEHRTEDDMYNVTAILKSEEGQLLVSQIEDSGLLEEIRKCLKKEKYLYSEGHCGEFLAELCGSAFSSAAKKLFPELKENLFFALETIHDIEDALLCRVGGEYLVDAEIRRFVDMSEYSEVT